MSIIPIKKLDGGLNLEQQTAIKDNQLTVCSNFFYNQDGMLQTRRGYKRFGNNIGTAPITSYFFYQNDSTLARKAVCNSGTVFYEYDEGTNTRVSKKTGLTAFEIQTGRTTWRTRRDYAVYKNILYMGNGVDNYASWNGTTYTEYASEPKIRYIEYMQDRLYTAGDDTNPISLYYTNALPADGSNINQNTLVVGGDENGPINAIKEIGSVILAFKVNKIYGINVSAPDATPIDGQDGGYCNRAIKNIDNSLVYFSERGVSTLKARYGVTGRQALSVAELGSVVEQLTSLVSESQFNSGAGYYIRTLNNYYFTFDTNGDNIPDTTLVYSSRTGGRSTYNYPTLYDYGQRIDSDSEYHYLFASAGSGQMFEMETGFDDDGQPIEHEMQTKRFDFGEPGAYKTFDFVDVVGYKNIGSVISAKVLIDGEIATESFITDANIDVTSNPPKTISSTAISTVRLTGGEDLTEFALYRFVVRVPLYATGTDVMVNLSSTGGIWIPEQIRISAKDETVDVFTYQNIL